MIERVQNQCQVKEILALSGSTLPCAPLCALPVLPPSRARRHPCSSLWRPQGDYHSLGGADLTRAQTGVALVDGGGRLITSS